MTLDELLSPDFPVAELVKLSKEELTTILQPYYTKSRQSLLPPDKPTKKGLDNRLIAAWIEANKDKLSSK